MPRTRMISKPFQHVTAPKTRATETARGASAWAKSGKGPSGKGQRTGEPRKALAGETGGGGRSRKKEVP